MVACYACLAGSSVHVYTVVPTGPDDITVAVSMM